MDPTGMEEQQSPFAAMMGAQPAAPSPLLSTAINPSPAILTPKPAGTPEELSTRKEGWNQVLSNPNFKRALMMAGQYLGQPMPYGQNAIGHLTGALGMGTTAFQAGEYADYEQGLKSAEEQRKQAETKAHTDAAAARLPGIKADSDVAEATKDTRTEDIKLKFKSARTKAEVDEAEAALAKRRLAIQQEIPDETVRAAETAKMNAAALAADEARARLGLTKAHTKEAETKAAHDQITVDVLKGMDEAERKEFLTKTKRYAQHTSGIGQQSQMWGDIYDKLPENDPSKSGKTKEQFQMDRLSSSKAKDAADTLTKYMQAGGDDPEVINGLTDLVKSGIAAKKGTQTGASTTEVWVRDKSGKLVKQGVSGNPNSSSTNSEAPPTLAPPPLTKPEVEIEDTRKYTRERIRGGWSYSLGTRGSGKTKAEWKKEDAEKN